jgi:tight adherence protein C
MELLLAVGLAGLAVVIGVGALGLQLQERAALRDSLRRLDDFGVRDTRDRELLSPVSARTLAPAWRSVVGFGRRVTPVGYLEQTRKKLVKAGRPEPEALDRFLVAKIVCILLIPVAIFAVFAVLDLSGLNAVLAAALFSFALFFLPDAILNRKVEERVHAIRISLPEILDLLVISVEAGLGFEQALDRVVDAVPGPLSDEFRRMLGEVRAGSSRADAMRAMEARLDVADVRSFILTMLQADTFGVSIGRVLRSQAEEMRIRRRQYAQELAQKAPVKMLIPMVFCIFPALFVVVLGPAVLDIMDAF